MAAFLSAEERKDKDAFIIVAQKGRFYNLFLTLPFPIKGKKKAKKEIFRIFFGRGWKIVDNKAAFSVNVLRLRGRFPRRLQGMNGSQKMEEAALPQG